MAKAGAGGSLDGGKTAPAGLRTVLQLHGAGDSCHQGGKRQNFIKSVCVQVAKSAAFALATIALIQGVSRHLPDSITVSSSVGGRELPIYCVETDKKQVALSFDAAWGNGR